MQDAPATTGASKLLLNTCLLALGAISISVPVGTGLAFYIERSDLRLRKSARAVIYGLLFVPAFVHVAAWDAGFGLQGWFGYATGNVVLAGWRAAIWLHAVTAIPWVTLIVMLGLRLSSSQLEEQATLDRGPWNAFRAITMRAAFPSIVAAAIWVFVVAANEITITDVYQVRTYAEEVYVGFALGDGVQEAQTRVLPGTILVSVLVLAAVRICRQFNSLSNCNQVQQPYCYRLTNRRRVVEIAAILLLATLVLVPLFNLGYKAGILVEQLGDVRTRVWSLRKLLAVVLDSPQRYATEISWSFICGQLVAGSAVVIAYALAWWHSSGISKFIGYGLAILGLAIPAPILALSIAKLFSQSHMSFVAYLYNDTVFVTWLVLTIRCFPFAYFLALHAVKSIGQRVLENAALDGLTPMQQLRWVGVGQLSQFFLSSWIICFAWVIGELSATILTVPPGVTTLSVTMFNLVHYGVEDRLAGICLFVIALSIMLAVLGTRLASAAANSTRGNGESSI